MISTTTKFYTLVSSIEQYINKGINLDTVYKITAHQSHTTQNCRLTKLQFTIPHKQLT